MCIICVKPSGANLPDNETLQRMFWRNPHGAGFMYPYNGRVEIRKGFMTFDGFTQALRNVYDRLGAKAPIIMHFRITTHGGTCPENTHPFPLTNDIAEMKRTSCSAKIGIAHNGIINIKTRDNTVSDTQEYIASVIYPIFRRNHRFYKTQRILNGIRDTINGSRMAILTGDGKVVRIGKWVQDGDLWYSNDTYTKSWIEYYSAKPYASASKPVSTAPVTQMGKRTYEPVRLPWERNSRVWANIMPLDSNGVYKDSDGYLWSGFDIGIDNAGRMYELDVEEGVAYEARSYIAEDIAFDKRMSMYFEVA